MKMKILKRRFFKYCVHSKENEREKKMERETKHVHIIHNHGHIMDNRNDDNEKVSMSKISYVSPSEKSNEKGETNLQ